MITCPGPTLTYPPRLAIGFKMVDPDEDVPRKLCIDEQQTFIDCMYVNSKCLQSGRKSFVECIKEEKDQSIIHEECRQLFNLYLRCRSQIVLCMNVIINHSRWIRGRVLEGIAEDLSNASISLYKSAHDSSRPAYLSSNSILILSETWRNPVLLV